ncbi:MAG: ABC transporter permease [Clostridiales bacterium]|nr:ABC transporter permease [Clostridiales bacterium]
MVKYVIKRLLLSIFILLGVSIILYTLVRIMPVDFLRDKAVAIVGSSGADPDELYQKLCEAYGLTDKTFAGLCKGYWSWLKNFISGDFGDSWKYNQPVKEAIFKNMPISFGISFVSLILQLLIAIPLGIKCACNQYGKLDYFATVLTMIGISFPTFFLGSLLIKFFAIDLGWFEIGGLISSLPKDATTFTKIVNVAWHLVLPMFLLTVLSIGAWLRYTRTNTLEVLNADYIRTARAKGLSENSVVYKHVFRNTLIPLVTLLAGTLPSLFSGAMITETIFDLPGVGNMAYQAMLVGDIPFIMTYNMFIAVLTVIGILLTDVMYAVVDPRVKLGD